MKKKSLIYIFLAAVVLTGCQPVVSDSAASGDYATINPLTAAEYSIYMNKEITSFASELNTHMSMLAGGGENYENLLLLAEESLVIMQDILDEIIVTYPASTYEDDRETTISVMQTAIKNMEDYIQDIKDEKPVSGYIDTFQIDFLALTGQANLYYQ